MVLARFSFLLTVVRHSNEQTKKIEERAMKNKKPTCFHKVGLEIHTRAINCLCTGLLIVFAQGVNAVTFETNAVIFTPLFAQSDPQGPTNVGSILSTVIDPTTGLASTIDFTGPANANSAANDSGAGAVSVDGLYATGLPDPHRLAASATFSDQFSNITGIGQNFEYNFSLLGPTLTIADFAGISAGDPVAMEVSFDFFARATITDAGGLVSSQSISSDAVLTGGLVSHTLTTGGTDPLSSGFFANGLGTVFGYNFANLTDQLIGTVMDGETLTLETFFSVSVVTPGFETGGAANIGDPFGLGTPGFVSSLSFTPVPLPAALWLFGTGLLGLIGMARRKQT
jgi:hypothetical protein